MSGFDAMAYAGQLDEEYARLLGSMMGDAHKHFDKKTTMLLLFGMDLCIPGRQKSIELHARLAHEQGATAEDLLAVSKLAFVARGMRSFGVAAETISKVTEEGGE